MSGLADKVVNAVKSGQIQRFYVIGGCDGAKFGRNYYTQLAEQSPLQSVILVRSSSADEELVQVAGKASAGCRQRISRNPGEGVVVRVSLHS